MHDMTLREIMCASIVSTIYLILVDLHGLRQRRARDQSTPPRCYR